MLLRVYTSAILTACTIALGSQSESWKTAMASALMAGGTAGIQAKLSERGTENPLEVDFASVTEALQASHSQSVRQGHLERAFLKDLRKAFTGNSLASYGSLLAKATVPDEAKLVLLRVILDGKLMASKGQPAVRSVLTGLLPKEGVSVTIKAAVLRGLGTMAAGPAYDSVLVAHLKKSDTTLKNAAYLGLGSRIRSNRSNGGKSANMKIFGDLKAIAEVSADIPVVRSLSQLGEDSARDYLAAKCAGNPDKIKVILFHDPGLSHSGIIGEAVKAQAMTGQSETMKKAIRYGVKDPEAVVAKMISDSSSQIEGGLKLLKDFPEIAPKFAVTVDGFQDSQDAAIKNAALALQPYLTVPGAQAE